MRDDTDLFATTKSLATLLEIAMEDHDALVALPELYQIDMGTWHNAPHGSRKHCLVCLAGCVMANTFQVDRHSDTVPVDFPENISERLSALDALRRGQIYKAYVHLHYARNGHSTMVENDFIAKYGKVAFKDSMERPWHESDPEAWRKYMDELLAYLKEKGL